MSKYSKIKKLDLEYYLHIFTYSDRSEFRIHATTNSNTGTIDEFCEDFQNDHDAVNLCASVVEFGKA